jgi:hypothetical protein
MVQESQQGACESRLAGFSDALRRRERKSFDPYLRREAPRLRRKREASSAQP